MSKFSFYFIMGALFMLLSWSDLSKYCRHQMIDWKFRASALQASAVPTTQDTLAYKYADDPDIMEFAETDDMEGHAGGMYYEDIEPELLAAAVARMDSSDSPKSLTWDMLRDVKFKRKYNTDYDQYFDYPVFGEKIKALDGQKVSIKGYIIPLDVSLYALSKNPYASCFFCGGAGPETIIGLAFAQLPKRYKTDDFVTLQGILRLNDSDVEKFMYQMYAVEGKK